MRKLSTGEDSTLRVWRELTVAMFGENSPAVAFLDDKIKTNLKGDSDEVIMEESQCLQALGHIHFNQAVKPPSDAE